ncbi:MAG: LysR family transcriptional regulator [Myxococcota bacterium]
MSRRDLSTLRNLNLNLLVLFEALHREGSLTRAAQQVGLSQSAASQALGRLRDSLGDPLFVRRRGGMEPTPRARSLAAPVRQALQTLERGLLAAQVFDPKTSERTFRLGFGQLGEAALLPRLVAGVSQLAPNVSLRSVGGPSLEVEDAAAHAELDLCFTYVPKDGSSVRFDRIGYEKIVVIARRDHPRINGTLTIEEFFAERHVLLHLEDERRQQVERMLRTSGPTRRVLAVATHYSTVPSIVAATDGLALVPRSLLSSPILERQLQSLAPPMPLQPLPCHMGWHPSLEADPGHAWLRSSLVNILRRSSAPLRLASQK